VFIKDHRSISVIQSEPNNSNKTGIIS
jgi:hypothetical protein